MIEIPRHQFFFTFSVAFLFGCTFFAFRPGWVVAFVLGGLIWVGFMFGLGRRHWLVALTICACFLVGCFYSHWYDSKYQRQISAIFPGLQGQSRKTLKMRPDFEVSGMVTNDPTNSVNSIETQTFFLETERGKIFVRATAFPHYEYGDMVLVHGTIERPTTDDFGRYLENENVVGTMESPEIARFATNKGGWFMERITQVRRFVRQTYQKILSPDQAAFMSGLTLSLNDDLTRSFAQKLSLSGTRHLTAVAGLHMSIITVVIFSTLLYFLPRGWAFALTFLLVAFFVALTGFHVPAIRAATMAFVAGFAKQNIRRSAPYNSVTVAALGLVLYNPKAPVLDVGFQLSFLAAVAIIYFEPILRHLLRVSKGEGFMGWKGSLFVTLSVQLLTAPVMITQFQNFSLVAPFANMFVLGVIPLIMILAFFICVFGALFPVLALLPGLLAAPLINYEIATITFFGRHARTFIVNPSLSFFGVGLYYAALVGWAFWFYRNKKIKQEKTAQTYNTCDILF